ncbi:hypothetical protein L210DRAFT_949334, partial [Boletus edulis BED1]
PHARIQLLSSQKHHGYKTTTHTFKLSCDHKSDKAAQTMIQQSENETLMMLRPVAGD